MMSDLLRNRASPVVILLAVAATLAVAQSSQEWSAPPEAIAVKSPLAATPQTLTAAAALFGDKCANCHGEKGKGDGPDAELYLVKPQDLTEPKIMGSMTEGEIFWKISEGRRPMPAFKKQFSEEQRWQLAQFVRSLVPKPPDPPPEKKTPPAKKRAAKKSAPAKN